ncbi:helix-turn-helix domain-containing protein [Haloarcula laminariae]|uniref:helix-turn-helix domain-containing protein n=1 Tax=Haloarcula laminariae TaxID=2961577 RepID=UPI0024058A03|nr:transposase [Halomicroarcula sp. FL173]
MGDSVTVQNRIPEAEVDRLLRAADSVERLRRLGFLKNLYQGDSIQEAITREGRSTSTGYRWVHQWNDGGLEAMLPDYGGGRPSKLSDSEQTAFRKIIRQRQPVSTETVVSILDEEFDVEYASDYLPQVLERLGLTYQPPDRKQASNEAILEAVEWDEKESTSTTGRHQYDRQNRHADAGWSLDE